MTSAERNKSVCISWILRWKARSKGHPPQSPNCRPHTKEALKADALVVGFSRSESKYKVVQFGIFDYTAGIISAKQEQCVFAAKSSIYKRSGVRKPDAKRKMYSVFGRAYLPRYIAERHGKEVEVIRTKKAHKNYRLDKRSVNVIRNLMTLAKTTESEAEIARLALNRGLLVLAEELRTESDEAFQSSFAEALEERLDDYQALEQLEKKSASLLNHRVRGSLAPMVLVFSFIAVALVLALLFAFGKFGMLGGEGDV